MKLVANNIAVLDEDSHASKWVEQSGKLVHDCTVERWIRPRIKHGDYCVDAGAFIGTVARAMCDAVGKDGKVFAFEPNDRPRECLKHNCPEAVVFALGLSSCFGLKYLHAEPGNVGASHLSRITSAEPVVSIPLDDLHLPRLDFFKIDVEGMEPEVIKGAERTLKEHKPVLFVEINRGALARNGHCADSIIRPLFDLGYQMQLISPEHSLDMEQIDVLFLPR